MECVRPRRMLRNARLQEHNAEMIRRRRRTQVRNGLEDSFCKRRARRFQYTANVNL